MRDLGERVEQSLGGLCGDEQGCCQGRCVCRVGNSGRGGDEFRLKRVKMSNHEIVLVRSQNAEGEKDGEPYNNSACEIPIEEGWRGEAAES